MSMAMSSCSHSSCSCNNKTQTVRIEIVQPKERQIEQQPTNPPIANPQRFTVVKTMQIGKHAIALINYPDCKNYEGNKILVFLDTKPEKIMHLYRIDPHFCEHCGPSPFARFVPTDEGWNSAIELCKIKSDPRY